MRFKDLLYGRVYTCNSGQHYVIKTPYYADYKRHRDAIMVFSGTQAFPVVYTEHYYNKKVQGGKIDDFLKDAVALEFSNKDGISLHQVYFSQILGNALDKLTKK